MTRERKIFRVFVSSTFTDMKEERRILQERAFPRLEQFCEENDASFQAVDLRWGVTEESQWNHETIDICLGEVAQCRKLSPKPNFLILIGDKYGWQPLPSRIPAAEMDLMFGAANQETTLLLGHWYKKDENAVPPEYILQPRSGAERDRATWEGTEREIRQRLRGLALRIPLTPEEGVKYFASATHQEILAGALDPPPGTESPEEHVYAFIRHIDGLPDGKVAEGFVDLVDDKPDRYCADQLTRLTGVDLKEKLKSHAVRYTTKWQNNRSVLPDPAAFADDVRARLQAVIETQIRGSQDGDELRRELGLHDALRDELSSHFVGRTGILQAIASYINDPSQRALLSLVGASGSGKSSIIARAAALQSNTHAAGLTVVRFIGTTVRSTHAPPLLLGVCAQIAQTYNINLRSLLEPGHLSDLHDLNGLADLLVACLSLATCERPICVFLDALDQLEQAPDSSFSSFWLPRELPPHAKLVVSSLEPISFTTHPVRTLSVPKLPGEDARTLLKRWLDSCHRTLTKEQFGAVMRSFQETGLPIYLKLAFERARRWHSYETAPTLPPDVSGILNGFMDTLEAKHTKELVRTVISYMLCGKYGGLAEAEILEVLAADKEYWPVFLASTHEEHRQELQGATKIPIVPWSRLYHDLAPYLAERDADGVPITTFLHRQFEEVLRQRYELRDHVPVVAQVRST